MTFAEIDKLLDKMQDVIFKDIEINKLNDYEKSFFVYKYLVDNISYDFELLERRYKKDMSGDLLKEFLDVLINKKGICSSISQTYKLLLEKIGIEVMAVLCNDGNPIIHQLTLVKRNNDWSFDDVTREIVKKEGYSNFGYGHARCKLINQKMLGVMPDSFYDNIVFKRNIKRDFKNLKRDYSSKCFLFKLPENIFDINIDTVKETRCSVK